MKKILLTAVVLLCTATFFVACEKNDYQHPGHRSGKV
jgi:hypothetical protein